MLFLVSHKTHSQVSTQTQNMHKAKGASTSVFPLRKFDTEQIFCFSAHAIAQP